MFSLGGSKRLPPGWGYPQPKLSIRWPFIKYYPIVWLRGAPATQSDIDALGGRDYDKGTICGKSHPDYKTQRESE